MRRLYIWLVDRCTAEPWLLLCFGCAYFHDVRHCSKEEKAYSWPYALAQNKPRWWRLMFCQYCHKFMCWETYHCPDFKRKERH